MSNMWVVLAATAGLIALSAFFVAVEFSLLGVKRHRLEDVATSGRAARAALRSSSELTVLLAGSQLGITATSLALGAVTKPALHHWLTPLLTSWNINLVVADVAGFVFALVVVTFLHLVIGEMVPKSWAIAHPEKSAIMLALPMRAFMVLFRPLLRWLNEAANRLLIMVGVTPTEHLIVGQTSDDLRQLVAHSANVGSLEPEYSAHLAGALELQTRTLAELVAPEREVRMLPPNASVADVQSAARESGHPRILIGSTGIVRGMVHVRDTLSHPEDHRVRPMLRQVMRLDVETSLWSALAAMRQSRNQLALVTEQGRTVGVITMTDVLRKVFPGEPREVVSVES